ncbi:MAG: TadE/TadG family type IV pilus assembly protein [Pseudomonadota bacterium]|jgi:Flp pilus assembly protein TadG
MSGFHAQARRRRAFRQDEGGAAAIEFAFVAPVLFFALLSLIEVGTLAMMSSGLDNAVVEASRRIRTGRDDAATSAATFEEQICANIGGSLNSCRERVVISVEKFTDFSDANAVIDGPPDDSFDKGGAGDIIIVKVDYRWPLMSPFVATAYGREGPMEVTLASRTAFKNEPFE